MKNFLFLTGFACFVSFGLSAETVYLKDGSTVKGSITAVSSGVFSLQPDEGAQRNIDKSSIDRIVFDSDKQSNAEAVKPVPETAVFPKPSTDFESPIKTFLAWKKAAEKGKLEVMADAFILVARDDQLAQLKNFSKEKTKEMAREVKKTEFAFGEPIYDGDKAYLSVTRRRNKTQRTEIVQFQKEGENWKMVPE